MPPAGDDVNVQRALWRSRRGMLELDLLLLRFAERSYRRLSAADQRAYLELLRLDDWVIWDWLQRARAPAASDDHAPPRLARIVALIAAEAGAQGEADHA